MPAPDQPAEVEAATGRKRRVHHHHVGRTPLGDRDQGRIGVEREPDLAPLGLQHEPERLAGRSVVFDY